MPGALEQEPGLLFGDVFDAPPGQKDCQPAGVFDSGNYRPCVLLNEVHLDCSSFERCSRVTSRPETLSFSVVSGR